MLSDKYTLGIDIGGTNLRMGLVDVNGGVEAFWKCPSDRVSGEGAVFRLSDMIGDYMKRNGTPRAICIGFPATVDKAKTTVLNAPNIKGFDGVPVGEILSSRFGLPVYIEKDVNLLLLCDMKRLGLVCGDVVACYIGTGIGNAIMIDGKTVSGASGAAGELGHIPFGDSGEICGCENAGCAETVAGGVYLARICEERFPGTDIGELFSQHGDHPLLCEYTERLARVIAAEVNILDPEVLLLGGGVIEMKDFPKKTLEEKILSHTRKPMPYGNLKILYSPVGDGTNGVVGAGLYAGRRLG